MGTRSYKLKPDVYQCCQHHAEIAHQWHKDHPNPLTLGIIMDNPQFWRNSKVCECCFAIYCDRDPMQPGVIVWEYDDQRKNMLPWDAIKGHTKADLKGANFGRPHMLWPLKKNDGMPHVTKTFLQREFDVLVHGRVHEDECTLVGWMGKHEFFERKLIATANDPTGLFENTWYVPEEWTHDLDVFAGEAGFVDGHFMHYCWCGRWGTHGTGVKLSAGQFGRWFCAHHIGQPLPTV
jgi:hypothetical protein